MKRLACIFCFFPWVTACGGDEARPTISTGGQTARGSGGQSATATGGLVEPAEGGTAGHASEPQGGVSGATTSDGAGAGGTTSEPGSGGAGGSEPVEPPPPTTVTIGGRETTTIAYVADAGGAGGGRAWSSTSFRTPAESCGIVFIRSEGDLMLRSPVTGAQLALWEAGSYEGPAWFATQADQEYELEASEAVLISFYAIEDPGEPDRLDAPLPLTRGEPIGARIFAGIENGALPVRRSKPNEYATASDYYAFSVPESFDEAEQPAKTKVRIGITPPANVLVGLQLYASDGTPVSNSFSGIAGAQLDITTRVLGGDYTLEVYMFGDPPNPIGTGEEIPANVVESYSLEFLE